MAKSDILVRAKADTSGYDANLAKARKNLEKFKDENLSAGGVMKQFSSQLVGVATQFASFGAAAAAALKVAKDAFMASERSVDEWGRTMEAGKSLYQGFLNALNTGDISGYLNNINQIVSAARAAYNELDRLGTLKTIQSPKVSAQQSEIDRIRNMIQTGRYIAPLDGRRAAMTPGQLLTPDQIRVLERQLQGGMDKLTTLIGNEVKQASKAIDAVYKNQANTLGMSVEEFRRGTSSMAEFEKRVAGATAYRQWQDEHSWVNQTTGKLMAPRTGNPYAQYRGWDVFRVDGDRYNELVRLIQQRDAQAGQAYGMQGQVYRAINRAEGITLSQIMGRGGGGGAGSGGSTYVPLAGSIDAQANKVSALLAEWRAAVDDTTRAEKKKQAEEAQFLLDIMMGKTGGIPAMNYGAGDLAGKGTPAARGNWQLDEKAMTAVADYISSLNAKTDEVMETVQKATGALSQVSGGLKQMGIDVPAGVDRMIGVIQGLIAVIQGVQTIIDIFSTTTAATQIASEATNTAAVTALTTAVTANTVALYANAAVPFSTGGVVKAAGGFTVPGNYGYDAVPAMLTSGEVVLNRSQAGNLASQLREGSRGGQMSARVSGEQIYLAMNNFLKRSGRGEIVTWK